MKKLKTTRIQSAQFYHIPTLPIATFLLGDKLKKELDLSAIHYLLYAMDWNNKL